MIVRLSCVMNTHSILRYEITVTAHVKNYTQEHTVMPDNLNRYAA